MPRMKKLLCLLAGHQWRVRESWWKADVDVYVCRRCGGQMYLRARLGRTAAAKSERTDLPERSLVVHRKTPSKPF